MMACIACCHPAWSPIPENLRHCAAGGWKGELAGGFLFAVGVGGRELALVLDEDAAAATGERLVNEGAFWRFRWLVVAARVPVFLLAVAADAAAAAAGETALRCAATSSSAILFPCLAAAAVSSANFAA